jgi:hypothetical protein
MQQTTEPIEATLARSRGRLTPSETIIPFNQRATCSVPEALAAIPASRSLFYKMVRRGRIKTIKVGAATRVLVKSLPGFEDA